MLGFCLRLALIFCQEDLSCLVFKVVCRATLSQFHTLSFDLNCGNASVGDAPLPIDVVSFRVDSLFFSNLSLFLSQCAKCSHVDPVCDDDVCNLTVRALILRGDVEACLLDSLLDIFSFLWVSLLQSLLLSGIMMDSDAFGGEHLQHTCFI